ncbi:MAG: electron transport complex subunit RsxC [Candidatus Hydrogenedentes bacterium]|nr:electron transport complex subunit RsxC [Candidatus Hydrogenedentota bacterium]
MLKTFRGGIHPAGNKDRTAGLPVVTMPPPDRVVLPVAQHIGAPARPCVEVGQKVRVGDVVAEPTGFVSAPVHATISGEVEAIEPRLHPLGQMVMSVVIRGDGKNDWVGTGKTSRIDISPFTPEEIRESVRNAGVVGLGGAAFPTHVKLSLPPDKTIDTYLLNGAECEPYLTCDTRLMVERPRDVVAGLRLMMSATGVRKGIIGIESNKPEAIESIVKQTERRPELSVEVLKVKYPQGAEKNFINALLGREVPSGGLPMDARVGINNVGTSVAVADAVLCGRPLVDRVVTVTGDCVREPKNVLVRFGTSFTDLIEFCGGLVDEPAKLIMGGPMMGLAQWSFDVPVIKGTSGLLILSPDHVDTSDYGACIRCGSCVRVCPMRLVPSLLGQLGETMQVDDAVENNLLDCVECGCCTYVCPTRRPMVHWIKWLKSEVAKQRQRERQAQAEAQKKIDDAGNGDEEKD